MTEQDRPTTPEALDAAAAESDPHDRETIPAPAPDAAQATPPGSDTAPTPASPLRLTADAASDSADGMETLRDSEVETWPPPPPVPEAVVVATTAPDRVEVSETVVVATTATDRAKVADTGSSIAPRELSQRAPPSPRSNRTGIALIGVAALIGAVAIALSRADRPTRPTRSDAWRETATSAAMPAPRDPVEPVAPEGAPAPESAPASTPAPSDATSSALAAADERAAPSDRAAPAARSNRAPGATTVRRRAVPARTNIALAPADLPDAPSRETIAASLNHMRSAIQLCTDGRTGVAELDLTIHGSGTVAHALVGGDFAGTPQGSCIARTLRGASFAPFQKPKFRVLYKLML